MSKKMNEKIAIDLLNLHQNFSKEDLKTAYIKTLLQYHPDICHEENANEKVKYIIDAFKFLEEGKCFNKKKSKTPAEEKASEREYEEHWQDIYNEVFWFSSKMPKIKEDFDYILNMGENYKNGTMHQYVERGILFGKDVGFFQNLRNTNDFHPSYLERLLLLTEGNWGNSTPIFAEISLNNPFIKGLNLKIQITSPTKFEIKSEEDRYIEDPNCIKKVSKKEWNVRGITTNIGISATGPYYRGAVWKRVPLGNTHEEKQDGIRLDTTVNFIDYLIKAIQEEKYEIELAEDCPKNSPFYQELKQNSGLEPYGTWIRNLNLYGQPIVIEGQTVPLDEFRTTTPPLPHKNLDALIFQAN